MPAKKSSPAMDFVVAALQKDPNAEYATVKDAASKKGFTIFPIMYGRAKALLGLVKVAPRGSKKKKAAAASAAASRRASAPRRVSARKDSSPIESLQAMIEDMQEAATERDRYRNALEKIATILDDAL